MILPITLDFETYSEAGYAPKEGGGWQRLKGAQKYGLSAVGMTRYLQDPSAEVLSLSWAFGEAEPDLWVPGMPMPVGLFEAFQAEEAEIEGWNVAFEVGVWRYICVPKLKWPALPLHKVRDAMARARAYSLPGALGNAGMVLGLDVQKDKRGGQLLDFFSVPRQPTKADKSLRNYPSQHPAKAGELYEYNRQDVRAERAIMKTVPPLSKTELEWWQVEQAINRRGVHVDMELVRGAITIHENVQERACLALGELTNSAVTSPTEVARIIGWLAERGTRVASLDEEAVEALLTQQPPVPPDVREVLEIRAAAASASVRKYAAVERQVCAGDRLHDLFIYHGARTGRETGADVQPQNLPNSGPDVRRCTECDRYYIARWQQCPTCGCLATPPAEEWNPEAARQAIETVSRGYLADLEARWGDPLTILSACLRGVFKASPGHVMLGSDYSAIEAVGAAMLTGEQWRIDVFRTHGKIYEMSASKTFGVPLEEILAYKEQQGKHHPLRKKGKVGELAGGYGGGKGAWRAFGAEGTDDELQQQVYAWRNASPQFPLTWQALSDAWIAAMNNPGTGFIPTKRTGEEVPKVCLWYVAQADVMRLQLPSGRCLTYHRPRVDRGEFGPDLSYEGWNTNPKMGAMGWIRLRTFGGRLFENLVQATCRDLLTHAAVNVWHAGFKIVTHVHDELVAEVPACMARTHDVSVLESLMMSLPGWAKDWPVKAAGGWMSERYQK